MSRDVPASNGHLGPLCLCQLDPAFGLGMSPLKHLGQAGWAQSCPLLAAQTALPEGALPSSPQQKGDAVTQEPVPITSAQRISHIHPSQAQFTTRGSSSAQHRAINIHGTFTQHGELAGPQHPF